MLLVCHRHGLRLIVLWIITRLYNMLYYRLLRLYKILSIILPIIPDNFCNFAAVIGAVVNRGRNITVVMYEIPDGIIKLQYLLKC